MIEIKGKELEKEPVDKLGHQLRGAPVSFVSLKHDKQYPISEKNLSFPKLNVSDLLIEGISLSSKSDVLRKSKDEEHNSIQKENTDSDSQSISDRQRNDKQILNNLVQSSSYGETIAVDLIETNLNITQNEKLDTTRSSQHKIIEDDNINFSFEVKGNGNGNEEAVNENTNLDFEDSLSKEKSNITLIKNNGGNNQMLRSDDKNNNYSESNQINKIQFEETEDYVNVFGQTKLSNEYFSGRFAEHQELEQNVDVREDTTDDEQNTEINNLIENISRKLQSR